MTTAITKLCIALAALTPAAAFAATQSVTETAHHTLADNESKNDARQLCASLAKRSALEKAGSVFESDLTAHKSETHGTVADDTNLQMRSYAAAVVRSEVTAEHFEMEHDHLALTCTVRVTFDPDEVKRKLQDIAGNGELRQKLAAQQAEMDILNSQLQSLNAKVKAGATAPVAITPPVAAPAVAAPAVPQAALSAPRPTASPSQLALAQTGVTSDLPPPLWVPPRPRTYIDPPTPQAQATIAAPTVALAQAQTPPQVVYQTVTVYPPAPTVYYYYQPYYYAPSAVYANRVAYARWYYGRARGW